MKMASKQLKTVEAVCSEIETVLKQLTSLEKKALKACPKTSTKEESGNYQKTLVLVKTAVENINQITQTSTKLSKHLNNFLTKGEEQEESQISSIQKADSHSSREPQAESHGATEKHLRSQSSNKPKDGRVTPQRDENATTRGKHGTGQSQSHTDSALDADNNIPAVDALKTGGSVESEKSDASPTHSSCESVKDISVPAHKKDTDGNGDTEKHGKELQDKLLKQRKRELEECHKEIRKLSNLNQQLRNERDEREQLHKEEIRKITEKLEKTLQEQKDKSHELEKMKYENEDLKKQYKDLFSDYSKLASKRMEWDNPNVANLGDEFRDLKIAEKYNQLYTSEWKKASKAQLEEISNKQGVFKNLLHTIQDIFGYCNKVAQEQETQLKTIFMFPVQDPREHVGQRKHAEIQGNQLQTLMELRKQLAVGAVKEVAEGYFKHKQNDAKGGVSAKLDEASKTYCQKCVEICWQMVLHNPPLYIDTEVEPSEPLDEDIFDPRSDGEIVEMLVWPPLYLGKGGKLLARGRVEMTTKPRVTKPTAL